MVMPTSLEISTPSPDDICHAGCVMVGTGMSIHPGRRYR